LYVERARPSTFSRRFGFVLAHPVTLARSDIDIEPRILSLVLELLLLTLTEEWTLLSVSLLADRL
jgi:hypothetical protein